MSEKPPQVPQVPPVERPQASGDDSLEAKEEDTLDKRTRSAAYRAEFVHDQHVSGLNARIDVLQSKLDSREEELHRSLPRVAELEQAEKTSKLSAGVETLGGGVGALLLSMASFSTDDWWKFSLFGAGISAAVLGVFAKVLFGIFGWPKKR